MGLNSVESLSRILVKNGAKRVLKDLKGRQPSYYFMNKADILRLQVLHYIDGFLSWNETLILAFLFHLIWKEEEEEHEEQDATNEAQTKAK